LQYKNQQTVKICWRYEIVNKHHPVSYKDFVLNGNTLANEAVAGDLAACSDRGVFLNFYESTDLSPVANAASVKIDEQGMKYLYIFFS
jgi:hypothetical protein